MANTNKLKEEKPALDLSTYLLSPKKRVLGLDLSLTGTGYCLYGGLAPEGTMGVIDTKGLSGMVRIDHILQKIREVMDMYEEDPPTGDLVIMEDFSFASKGASLFQIAGLGYIVRHYLWERGISYILVPPTMLKKYVTGVGNADKNVILKEVYKRWKVDIDDDNIADAYVLARIGRALQGNDTECAAFQNIVLGQLKDRITAEIDEE